MIKDNVKTDNEKRVSEAVIILSVGGRRDHILALGKSTSIRSNRGRR